MSDVDKGVAAVALALEALADATTMITGELARLQSAMRAQSDETRKTIAEHQTRAAERVRKLRALVGDPPGDDHGPASRGTHAEDVRP